MSVLLVCHWVPNRLIDIYRLHTVLLTSFFRTSQYHKNISTLGQKSRCISLTIQDTAKLRVFLKSPQNFASDKSLTNKYEHSSLAGYLVLNAKIDESVAQPQVQEGNISMLFMINSNLYFSFLTSKVSLSAPKDEFLATFGQLFWLNSLKILCQVVLTRFFHSL